MPRGNQNDFGTDCEDAAEWRDATGRIIACAIEVHCNLGPGLLERLYEEAMEYELNAAGARVQRQVAIRIPYKAIQLSEQRLDMVVDGRVVVELKCVERVSDVHLATLVSYLRASGHPLGLLINFNVPVLKQGIFRRANTLGRSRPPVNRPTSPSSASSASSAFTLPGDHS